jgi:hypothetical protein
MQTPFAVLLLSLLSVTALPLSTAIEKKQSGPKQPNGIANDRSVEPLGARPEDVANTSTGLLETLKVTRV